MSGIGTRKRTKTKPKYRPFFCIKCRKTTIHTGFYYVRTKSEIEEGLGSELGRVIYKCDCQLTLA